MTTVLRWLMAGCLLFAGGPVIAQTRACEVVGYATIGNGFQTGTSLNQLSDRDLGAYLMGIVDAFSAVMLFGADDRCYKAIRACSVGRDNIQMTAIVKKYLRENPENWHYQGSVIVYNALFRECLYR